MKLYTSDIILSGNIISNNEAVAGAGIYIGIEQKDDSDPLYASYNALVTLNSSGNTITNNLSPLFCTAYSNVSNGGGGGTINADTDLTETSTFTFSGDTISSNGLYDLVLEVDNRSTANVNDINSNIGIMRRYASRDYDTVLCPHSAWWKRPCILKYMGELVLDGTAATDDDGAGFSENQGDCDDHDSGIYPEVRQ